MPETNISLKVNASELDAKLSKSMKALGVHHDEYGRLVNAQGQFVESLSQASIRMGNYIDAAGRMRNANGQLMDGLTSLQKKMRNYVDDLGNIHDVTGEIIGNINKLTDSVNQVPEGIQNDSASCNDLLKELADSTSKVSVAFLALGVEGPLKGTLKTIGELHAKMNLFVTSINEIKRGSAIFNSLKAQIDAVGKKQAFVNLLTTNYVSIAAGIASVVTVVLDNLGSQVADLVVSQEGYVDALDKTAMAMASVKDEGNNIQKAIAVAGAKTNITLSDQADQLVKNIDLLEEAVKSGEKWQARFTGAADALIVGGLGVAAATGAETFGVGAAAGLGAAALGGVSEMLAFKAKEKTEESAQKLAETQSQLADQILGLVDQDLPQKESDALQERLNAYDKYENLIREKCDVENDDIVRVLDKIAEAKANIEGKIVEAKRKELNIDKDVAQYFEQSRDHVLTYDETIAKITETVQKNNLSLEEQNEAIERATKNFEEMARKDLGVDSMLEALKTPTDKYNEAMEKVSSALKKGFISQEQSRKLEEYYKGQLVEKSEEPDQREVLGVDSMLESLKTPIDRYNDEVAKATEAFKAGYITEEQCNDLKKQYAQSLYSDVLSALDSTKTAQERYNEAIARAAEAHEAGVITEEQCNALKKQYAQNMYSDVLSALDSTKTAQEKYDEATKRAADARRAGVITEQQHEELKKKYADDLKQQNMQSLGLSSLLEEIKTPMEKYKEQIKKVDDGLKKQLITRDEAKKMKDLLYQKFFPEDFGGESDTSMPELKRAEDRAKEAPLAKSVTAGSQEMYSLIAGQNKDRVDKIEHNLASFVDLFRDYTNKFDAFAREQDDVQFALLS